MIALYFRRDISALMMTVMPSRRKFALMLLTISMAHALAAMPFRVPVKGWWAELYSQGAFAKDGKGGGSGNGNGKGIGNGKGGGNGKGSSGSAAGATPGSPGSNHVNPSTGDVVQASGNNIDVLHRNGMREGIKAGRYIMKDGKGRTIIERRATGADVSRLRDMMD